MNALEQAMAEVRRLTLRKNDLGRRVVSAWETFRYLEEQHKEACSQLAEAAQEVVRLENEETGC